VAALPDGERLELFADPERSASAIRQLSPRDAARWPEFAQRMGRIAAALEAVYAAPPPDVRNRDPGELLRLAGLAVRTRRMGRRAVVDLLRVLPMSVAELLDDWFETDALKGVLAAAGVLHLAGTCSGGRVRCFTTTWAARRACPPRSTAPCWRGSPAWRSVGAEVVTSM
jgi:phytoene dehydrogenase-like protein